MQIYESEEINRQDLLNIRKKNVCKVCGGWLNVFLDNFSDDPMKRGKAFIACADWLRTHHDGIEKEASQYQQKGMEALNILARREIMEKEIGKDKAVAIRRFEGLTSLTIEDAKAILTTIWPKATGAELYKAMNICAQYGLNPLMRHLYMIPFKEKLVCVLGIGANRLIASRKHKYSYVDDTPRMMTEDEEKRRYGEADKSKLRAITKLKDMATGAEASGYGEWPRTSEPYGTDKGNSKANMAFIRSERQALDKLYPADMPSSQIPVVDDRFINGEYKVIDEEPKPEPPPETPKEESKTTEEAVKAGPSEPAKQEPEKQKEQPKPARDPLTIKSKNDMTRACHDDFNMSQSQWIKEAGYSSFEDISEPLSDIYIRIREVKGVKTE